METLFLAFWNVENLFDVESAVRTEKLRKVIASDIKGWDDALLDAKLRQLSLVIRSMNGGNGPDMLGVCEVENKEVLDKLTKRIKVDGGRSYSVSHADTKDSRGIDVAFLYDGAIATTTQAETFQHWVVKRNSTRDLFQVNFTVDGKKLVLIGNHWPSRTAGQYESEPYRMVAGETLAYWVERIHEELGEDVPIVAMGDFNDEPFNRSITEYALSTSDASVVLKGQNQYLYNLMWPILASGQGSHFYGGQWNQLDQIMVSRAVVSGKSGWTVQGSASIEGTGIMSNSGKPGPRRFGISPKERDTGGFSDHYPVSVTLKKPI
jgi:predicted extracellular nuclease